MDTNYNSGLGIQKISKKANAPSRKPTFDDYHRAIEDDETHSMFANGNIQMF